MERKYIVIIVIAVVIVGAAVWVVIATLGSSGGGLTSGNSTPNTGSADGVQKSTTWAPAPTSAVAPNEGVAATSVANGTAVPVVQVPASANSSADYRSFNISIAKNAYSPDTIIVNLGDTVNLSITATDANYGFTQPDYGLGATIPKGKTQQIQFQALQPGKFTFYCASCGGPSKGPVGYIVVTAQ